jgi:transcription antitermination factor NusG
MWTPDMFMPGYNPDRASLEPLRDDSWRRSKEKVMGVVSALNRPHPTPEQKRELDNAAMKFHERQMRAAVARANGASSAEVVRIMEEQ